MIFRVVNQNNEVVSGYNNTGSTYQTLGGAQRCVTWAKGIDERFGREGNSYRIEYSPLDWQPWEPCEFTQSHTREWCGNIGCREG